ncbi:ComEA family DNA-binding protein [Vibrio salinus]|uniref:ComEA family DNA-binding protein n=1 Tax=Vibrio salinus TaxID=2899784 RepID=UPI001E2F5583|nr:helix-hairpin-helix domain-containing protein [Vibrio salinus]MCE0492884.1 helix-hairpin-helix domain-containing protein [Vibrio salinus]
MSLKKLIVMVLFSLFTAVSVQATESPVKSESISKSESVQKSIESVNINKASAEEMSDKLKGIGQAKAKAIVDYRNINGAFSSAEELTKVKGIGKAILEKNKGRILL